MAAPSTSADTAIAAVGQADPLAGMLLRTSLGLLIVLGLLLVLAWAARRWGHRWRQTGQVPLKVVGSLALGPRERILVVAVGETCLVVGVSPSGMQTLHTLSAEELPEFLGAGGEAGPRAGSAFGAPTSTEQKPGFTARLQQAVRRRQP